MSDAEAGSLFGLWSLGYGLLTLFAGALCDVIGIKPPRDPEQLEWVRHFR